MRGARTYRRWLIAAFFLVSSSAAAEYPLISSLTPSDPVFAQFQQDLERGYKAETRKEAPPPLTVYRYVLPKDSDLFTLAASLNVPYDSIGTLNRLGSLGTICAGSVILLPGKAGVFLPDSPSDDLEYLMASWRSESSEAAYPVSIDVTSGRTKFLFFPGSRFSAEERAFFLNVLFRFPLPVRNLTSSFGNRVSPISGRVQMHAGIDLAAPSGTSVFPSREGVVSDTGYNATYGNYVIISHQGAWETVYGHLKTVAVRLNENVLYGMIIGTVGSTGESTGPHLHFEIRDRGVPRDPESLLPAAKGKR
jgi:murein DD-endopeptidase MepM/ murein hydrolase activator NlpD